MERPRVLLVEDNLLMRWWMISSLERAGYSVSAPGTVDEALREGMAHPIDLLITDCELPCGRDGFEVLVGLRQIYSNMQAVLITADADEELAARATRAGFNRVILKPVQPAEVLEALKALRAESRAEVSA